MTTPTRSGRSWWMTAETAAGAAAQLPLWLMLLAGTMFALYLDPTPTWWCAACAWTAGLIASGGTVLARSGMRWRVAQPTSVAGSFSWGLLLVALGLVVVIGSTAVVATGNPTGMVVAGIAGAVAARVAIGSRK